MSNLVKYTPKQLLAIDLISSNPMVSTDSVAKNIGVTSRTINNWLQNPHFVEAVYNKYMELSGIELPKVVQAMIEEAKEGNVQAGRLVLEHYGKLENKLKIEVEANFDKFLKAEDVDFVEIDDNDLNALDNMSKAIGTDDQLPNRNPINDKPHLREKEEKSKIQNVTKFEKKKYKEKQYQKEIYKIRKRAKAVGLELLPSGRHPKGVRKKWMEELESLENDN